MSKPEVRISEVMGTLPLLIMPTRVSSLPSYGPWPVCLTVAPVSVIVITLPQPTSLPTFGGHCAVEVRLRRVAEAARIVSRRMQLTGEKENIYHSSYFYSTRQRLKGLPAGI